jgi:hypothetical protein
MMKPSISLKASSLSRYMPVRLSSGGSYLLLGVILVSIFLALVAVGLNLGFVGDILNVEYHFDRLGLGEGIRWTLTYDRKHFLLGEFYALIYWLSPGQSFGWYASSLFTHLFNGILVFALADWLLRGQKRWLSFSIALIFIAHTRQVETLFEIATGGHQKISAGLAFLSLWLYMKYVRDRRRNPLWREFSIASYIVSIMLYEATILFFLLFPLIAYLEDKQQGLFQGKKTWVIQVVRETFWYPLLAFVFLGLYTLLLPNTNQWLSFSPGRLVQQFTGVIAAEVAPGVFVERVVPALEQSWWLLAVSIILGVFLIVWGWRRRETMPDLTRPGQENDVVILMVFGVALLAANILTVAPTAWPLADHPRLTYPGTAGIAMIVSGSMFQLLSLIRDRAIRQGIFALGVAVLVGTGTTRIFQMQQHYVSENESRETVKTAIREAIPEWNGSVPPYLLVVSDAHPTRDLALHAQDINFPRMFDILYGVQGIAADAIFSDVPASLAPSPDLPGSRYIGPFIVVEPEGIYSPLNPGVPIDPQRLVIVYYDSQTQSAHILDELPADVLATANIVERAPIEWRTNHALIDS